MRLGPETSHLTDFSQCIFPGQYKLGRAVETVCLKQIIRSGSCKCFDFPVEIGTGITQLAAKDIDVDTYLDLYKGDEKAIVLFSRPTCGFCQIAEPILQHISYQYDLTINHINTDEMDSDDSTNLVESNDYFSDGLGTPLLMVVSNGEIVDVVSGLVDTASYVDFFSDNGFIKE